MATAVAARPMTAEEFARRPDPGYPEELVRGDVVATPQLGVRPGEICGQAYYLIRQHVEPRELGRVISNDSGVITERHPDTVRGADVAYYSYARIPKGPAPQGYAAAAPDLVVEVRPPSERWKDLQEKVGEYLKAGVQAIIVLDMDDQSAHVFSADAAPRHLAADEELTLPEALAGFRAPVGRFFP